MPRSSGSAPKRRDDNAHGGEHGGSSKPLLPPRSLSQPLIGFLARRTAGGIGSSPRPPQKSQTPPPKWPPKVTFDEPGGRSGWPLRGSVSGHSSSSAWSTMRPKSPYPLLRRSKSTSSFEPGSDTAPPSPISERMRQAGPSNARPLGTPPPIVLTPAPSQYTGSSDSLRSFFRRHALLGRPRQAPIPPLAHVDEALGTPGNPTIRSRQVDFEIVASPTRSSLYEPSRSLKRAASTPHLRAPSPASPSPRSAVFRIPRFAWMDPLTSKKSSHGLRHAQSSPQLRSSIELDEEAELHIALDAAVAYWNRPARSRTSTHQSGGSRASAPHDFSRGWSPLWQYTPSELASTGSRPISPAAYLFVDGCLPPGMTMPRRLSIFSSFGSEPGGAGSSQKGSPPRPLMHSIVDESEEGDSSAFDRSTSTYEGYGRRTRSTTLPSLHFTSAFDGGFLVRPPITVATPASPQRLAEPRPKAKDMATQTEDAGAAASRPSDVSQSAAQSERARAASTASADTFLTANGSQHTHGAHSSSSTGIGPGVRLVASELFEENAVLRAELARLTALLTLQRQSM